MRGKGDEELLRVEGVLARVYRENGYEAEERHTPLTELIGRELREEGGDPEFERVLTEKVRQETLHRLCEYLFADGPHPGAAMRRVYAFARAYRPELVAWMNGSQLALMFGETRAAQSWRVNQMITRRLTAAGAHGNKLPFQKSTEAGLKYSAAQKGNKNRLGKTKAKRAKKNAKR